MKIAVVPSSNKEIDKYTSPLVSTIIFGLKDFSVNYPELSLEEIKNFSLKNKDIDIFVSINKTIFNEDLESVERYLIELDNLSIKGVLFYDLGILNIYKRHKFKYSLVWHQTHMVTNYNTCNFWYNQGVNYAFLSSEITKFEIENIIKNTKMKLIITLFGHIPMFTSKRHLVNNYLETFNLKTNGKYIYKEEKTYPIVDNQLGTVVYSCDILNGLEETLELKNNYIFLNNFNIDEEKFLKVVKLYNQLNPNNLTKTKQEIEEMFKNTSKCFLYTETIYKVKKS